MAQPAKGSAHTPCSTPPVHTEDTATSVHPVDEKLRPARLVPAALQHIAAMYAGVVTPPLIIGQACGLDMAARTRLIAASLIVAGVATLLQTIGVRGLVGNRLPFVNAASSTGIAPILAIAETNGRGHQLPAIYGAVLVAGIIPLAAPAFYAGFPAWARTVLGSGISAGALVAVLLNLFFHHLGTRSRLPAPALKSS